MDDFDSFLESCDDIHYPCGVTYQRIQRIKALRHLYTDELRAVYHLVESHTPALRLRAAVRYGKMNSEYNKLDTIPLVHNNYIDFKCASLALSEKVEDMLNRLMEMPEQWTLVQLTPKYNAAECLEFSNDVVYSNALHITVFGCGSEFHQPFVVNVREPKNGDGTKFNLIGNFRQTIQEYFELLNKNKKLSAKTVEEQLAYVDLKRKYECDLKNAVSDMAKCWLREWRCLLVGKCEDMQIEHRIHKHIKTYIAKKKKCRLNEKQIVCLCQLTKCAHLLSSEEVESAVASIVQGMDTDNAARSDFIDSLKKLNASEELSSCRKHPVILILDDKLEELPWEMMDVCLNESITRISSFHFLYALFKEHQPTIIDGYKIINDYKKQGVFIINPGKDLMTMEQRMGLFFKFWTPEWRGLIGITPTESEFETLLVNSSIFSYHGHGSGTQFLAMEKIERLRINAVVLLFGCGSTKLNQLGPQCEMYGAFQMYFIACSPCIVGMLWTVTDKDTDVLSAEFISSWLPSPRPNICWSRICNTTWRSGKSPKLRKVRNQSTPLRVTEPGLLRALCLSKQTNTNISYMTRAAFVCHGLPVKII